MPSFITKVIAVSPVYYALLYRPRAVSPVCYAFLYSPKAVSPVYYAYLYRDRAVSPVCYTLLYRPRDVSQYVMPSYSVLELLSSMFMTLQTGNMVHTCTLEHLLYNISYGNYVPKVRLLSWRWMMIGDKRTFLLFVAYS